jgi:hypothetical protein
MLNFDTCSIGQRFLQKSGERLAVKKAFCEYGKVLKYNRVIRRKNLFVHRENAKRPLAYSSNTPKDVKLSISPFNAN